MKSGTKMHLGEQNLNWYGARSKFISELFQEGFSFSAQMFACRDQNVKFFSLQAHNLSHTT